MLLVDFMANCPPNWEEILSKPPYNLKITHDGPYVILKYQQFITDMSYTICKEARGAIFREYNGYYIPISIAMTKFFNAAEHYADTEKLDWSTAVITEKVDGSLMRLAYDEIAEAWLLSSNGSIYARDVTVGDTNFEEIFISILVGQEQYQRLLSSLNKTLNISVSDLFK